MIAFPGAAGATLAGLPIAVGYFGACGLGALALSLVGRPRSGSLAGESAAIGAVQAFGLGLGFLFVSLYGGQLNGLESLLFGTFLGITAGQVQTLFWVVLIALAVLLTIARPLLFASVDSGVARAAGVPTSGLGLVFLLLLGLAVAATAQITGALLVFALLVTPAATAQELTARPGRGLALSLRPRSRRDLDRLGHRRRLARPGRLLGGRRSRRALSGRCAARGRLARSMSPEPVEVAA